MGHFCSKDVFLNYHGDKFEDCSLMFYENNNLIGVCPACVWKHGDERGHLVSLEEYNDIPFRIKRVYYMYETKEGVRRGYHAHKSLKQILVCIHGSCKILLDNGKENCSVGETV